MTTYTFAATCPRCGGDLIPDPEAAEVLAPEHSTTLTRCDFCLYLFRLDLVATVAEAWPVDKLDPEAFERSCRDGAALGVSDQAVFG